MLGLYSANIGGWWKYILNTHECQITSLDVCGCLFQGQQNCFYRSAVASGLRKRWKKWARSTVTWVWVFMQCVAVKWSRRNYIIPFLCTSIRKEDFNILWDVKSYLVALYRRFGGTYCLPLQDARVNHGGKALYDVEIGRKDASL
jgi:hypothetical protein